MLSETSAAPGSHDNKMRIGDLCSIVNGNDGREYCKYRFLIPAYQRGYRWTPDQVMDLLLDIDENIKNGNNKSYCLQPLVVKKKIAEDGAFVYELIDGQQRLTTLFLILCALADSNIYEVFALSTERKIEYLHLLSEETYIQRLQDRIEPTTSFFDALKTIVECKDRRITRKDYCDFFKLLGSNENYQNIDRVYLLQALNTILSHYYNCETGERKPHIEALSNKESTIIEHIKEQFYFLWYETEDTAEATFSRLNSGKISLNNADLIKALLLRRENLMTPAWSNLDDTVQKIWLEGFLENKRTEVISQWDNMEQILRSDDDRFWNFIAEPDKLKSVDNKYFSRLEIIFDLQIGIVGTKQNDDFNQQYRIYRFFEEQVKQINGLTKDESITGRIWAETVKIFNIMREWYEDHELYHYIGYLSCLPVEYITPLSTHNNFYPATLNLDAAKTWETWRDILTELIRVAGKEEKHTFLDTVKQLVRWTIIKKMNLSDFTEEHIDAFLSKLTYDKSQEEEGADCIENRLLIKNLLLLCNIQELICSKNLREADHKFPFKLIKVETEKKFVLTLEHIRPQNPEFSASNNQKKTIEELQQMYDSLCKHLEQYKIAYIPAAVPEKNTPAIKNLTAEFWEECIRDIWKQANPDEVVYPQRFYNLTLLQHGINSTLKNHIFPVKRDLLLQKTEEQYIPLSTQNVFLKSYSWRFIKSGEEEAEGSTDSISAEHPFSKPQEQSPLFWQEVDAVAYRKKMSHRLYSVKPEESK